MLPFILLSSKSFGQHADAKFIPFSEKTISYMGRFGMTDSCAEIYWTGTNISINIKAAHTVRALLADTRDNNFYYVIVDGDDSKPTKIKVDKAKKMYALASFNDNG